jgi:hypothetical protein
VEADGVISRLMATIYHRDAYSMPLCSQSNFSIQYSTAHQSFFLTLESVLLLTEPSQLLLKQRPDTSSINQSKHPSISSLRYDHFEVGAQAQTMVISVRRLTIRNTKSVRACGCVCVYSPQFIRGIRDSTD